MPKVARLKNKIADSLLEFARSASGEVREAERGRGVRGGVRDASPSAARCTTARNCHAAPYRRQHPGARYDDIS